MNTNDRESSRPDRISPPVWGDGEIDQEVTRTTFDPMGASSRFVISESGQFPRGQQPRTPSHRPIRTVTNP